MPGCGRDQRPDRSTAAGRRALSLRRRLSGGGLPPGLPDQDQRGRAAAATAHRLQRVRRLDHRGVPRAALEPVAVRPGRQSHQPARLDHRSRAGVHRPGPGRRGGADQRVHSRPDQPPGAEAVSRPVRQDHPGRPARPHGPGLRDHRMQPEHRRPVPVQPARRRGLPQGRGHLDGLLPGPDGAADAGRRRLVGLPADPLPVRLRRLRPLRLPRCATHGLPHRRRHLRQPRSGAIARRGAPHRAEQRRRGSVQAEGQAAAGLPRGHGARAEGRRPPGAQTSSRGADRLRRSRRPAGGVLGAQQHAERVRQQSARARSGLRPRSR